MKCTNLTDAARRAHEELFPNHVSTLKATDPELIEVFDNFAFDEVLRYGNLDTKTRLMVILASTIGSQALSEYKVMLDGALNVGVTPVEIKEILYQSVPYVGIAKAFDFVHATNENLQRRGIKLPLEGQSTTSPETRHEKGLEKQKAIFGDLIDRMYKESPENQLHIQRYLSANCFGDYYTRTGLDIKTRELLTFSIILSLGGCEPQLKGHIQGNVNVGNGRETLLSAITQCLPYVGYPRTLNALRCLNEVIPETAQQKPATSGGFDKGEVFKSDNFNGTVWLKMLVEKSSPLNCPIGNVTFEPGCRNSWHRHSGGQILLVTDGVGCYQEKGKPARRLRKGDVVEIMPDVTHWHGATPDHGFSHLAIEVNSSANQVEWLDPLTETEYADATAGGN